LSSLAHDTYPKGDITMSELMTIDEVATLIHRTPATIRWWIHEQSEVGPLFAKMGRRRMARRADIEAWVAKQFAAVTA